MTVRLLNGFQKTLTYSIPATWKSTDLVGTLVQVPLKERIERALVCAVHTKAPAAAFTIRPAHAQEQLPGDPGYHDFIAQLCNYYRIDPISIYRRIHQPPEKNSDRDPILPCDEQPRTTITLTPAQRAIVEELVPIMQQPRYYPALLHGVTGSGKTEIYKEIMRAVHAQGRTTVLLLPEVSLANAFARILRTAFDGAIPLYECHSATPQPAKRLLWKALHAREPMVIIGVHLPILLPIPHLGALIVDEEHEAGFQEKSHPRINTKEAALIRAHHYKIPIIMGSATPSLTSLYNTTHRGWKLFTLHERFGGTFPQLRPVTLTTQRRTTAAPDSFWITPELRDAISERLARREQTIIFLNRRGMNRFVQCAGCAHLFACTACSVSLTLHTEQLLICHYCGSTTKLPNTCPACRQPAAQFLKKGIGTQRIVALLQDLFPQAVIDRADTDTTKDRKRWHETMQRMHRGQIDILVGTQTIAKGYHFPAVTLVGIVWAESNLSFPFYTATETTLQQILQVAGRAGRARPNGEVIIQSFIKHPLFSFLDEARYLDFYEYELQHRRTTGYPPCLRLAQLELFHHDEAVVDQDAALLAQRARADVVQHAQQIRVLGPALPPIAKIQHRHSRIIYLKGTSRDELSELVARLLASYRGASSCFFTPNPMR